MEMGFCCGVGLLDTYGAQIWISATDALRWAGSEADTVQEYSIDVWKNVCRKGLQSEQPGQHS